MVTMSAFILIAANLVMYDLPGVSGRVTAGSWYQLLPMGAKEKDLPVCGGPLAELESHKPLRHVAALQV